jgi:hypothetical protein
VTHISIAFRGKSNCEAQNAFGASALVDKTDAFGLKPQALLRSMLKRSFEK